MSTRADRQRPFVASVMRELGIRFAEWGHNPSRDNLAALAAIADVIECMAAGRAQRATYLSCAPVGAGKTETIVESIVQLMTDERYRDCGVIVFLAQLKQVERLAKALGEKGVPKTDISVLVGNSIDNHELRMLGRGHFNKHGEWVSEHQKARIVLATQAKLHSVVAFRRAKHVSSSLDAIWLYQGEPRRVRVWDETILPANTSVLHEQEIRASIKLLRDTQHDAQADIIERWLGGLKAGEPTEVPAFDSKLNMAALQKRGALKDDSAFLRLLGLQWEVLAVREDDGNAVLHYSEILPEAFTPLLVTDASGTLRHLYQQWSRGRGTVLALPSGDKRYDRLRIHHWDHPVGKEKHRMGDTRAVIAHGAASVFQHIPEDEEVLFVVRKPEKAHHNMEVAISAHLTPEQAKRANFLTWGLHTATNNYAHIKHVVLVGVLQTSFNVTAAQLRAAGKLDPEQGLGEPQVLEAHLGEICHHIFQAAGRGKVRQLDGDQCPDGCTLWAIFCTTGKMRFPRAHLNRCFPGAKIENWLPFGTQLATHKLKSSRFPKLAEALLALLGEKQEVSFTLYDFPHIGTANGLRKQLSNPIFRAWFRERGLEFSGPMTELRDRGGSWAQMNVWKLGRGEPG